MAPEEAAFYRILGRLRAKEKQYEVALEAYEQAVRLDSSDAATFVELAKVELGLDRHQKAVAACQRSIALAPSEKDAYFILAQALRQLGRAEESRQILEQFRRLDREEGKIRKQLRILDNAPDDHEARAMLGLLYTQQGRYPEAAEAYRLATRLAPDSMRYHNNLGNALLRLEEYDKAIEAYTEALHLDSEYVRAYYNLGLAHFHRQRFALARQALLQARQRHPEDADVNYYLGLLYAREGDFEQAAEVFEQVVGTRPDFLDARHKLAVSYLKLGRYEDSKKQLAIIKEKQAGGTNVESAAKRVPARGD